MISENYINYLITVNPCNIYKDELKPLELELFSKCTISPTDVQTMSVKSTFLNNILGLTSLIKPCIANIPKDFIWKNSNLN